MIRFFRQFGQAVKGLFRNGMMTFLSLSSMVVTLTILGVFASFAINAERLTTGVEGNVKVTTVLAFDSTDAHETITKNGKTETNPDYHKIYDQIKALPEVEEIEFSSKDEQLQELIATMGEEFQLLEQDNPLADVYMVSAKTSDALTDLSAKISEIEGVDEVTYGGLQTEKLFALAKSVRLWGLIVSAVVLLVAIFLVANTIRLTIMARSNEIQIMRLVGATKSYIRVPFVIEGILLGLLGSILPSVLIFFGYEYVYQRFTPELLQSGLSLYPPFPFLYYVLGGLAVFGILLGALGSRLSIRRYLKL